MTTITARLDEETKFKLECLAQNTARSKSWLVADAIKQYIADEAWQIEAIQEGIKEAELGNFASDEQVKQTFARFGVYADK